MYNMTTFSLILFFLSVHSTLTETILSNSSKEFVSPYPEVNGDDKYDLSELLFDTNLILQFLPNLVNFTNNFTVSSECNESLTKFISALNERTNWAMEMFHSTSKTPAGISEGIQSDFGAFDQCLNIKVTQKFDVVEFQGKYCAIEINPLDSKLDFGGKTVEQHYTTNYWNATAKYENTKSWFGVCIPSTCSLTDIRSLAQRVGKSIRVDLNVPMCYERKNFQLSFIHIAVICIICILLMLGILGSYLEFKLNSEDASTQICTVYKCIICFSLISNYRRLISSSKRSEELRALNGVRILTLAWIMVGHNNTWRKVELVRSPITNDAAFRIDFGLILNSWIAVELFFFINGLVASYTVLPILTLLRGKINVPIYIFRRYFRFMPLWLITMGLALFMPVVSSGPFWHSIIDHEINSCMKYWWTNLLGISNWTSMKKICVSTTWFIAADLQLHALSILLLYPLYRCPKVGLILVGIAIASCNTMVGIITYLWNLPPIVLTSLGNELKNQEVIDKIHLNTFTHAGPYCIGVLVGYILLKNHVTRLKTVHKFFGWIFSFLLTMTSIYGAHSWNNGHPYGTIEAALFAAIHRTTFTIGVAWVVFVSVTGNCNLINNLLSSTILATGGRLCFTMFLQHSFIFWVRDASFRDRFYLSNYNLIYEYIGNVAFTSMLSIAVYLLLGAPLTNLDELIFAGNPKETKNCTTNLTSQGNAINLKIQTPDSEKPNE